ncbi:unnamed protein product [Prorocentrum cordatum]|uniref:Solute carrier family 40 protein n=1 Tax=Prorocentrum cordatum TaxID=2364126 RepID=A0ABN9SU74_9DINO|nr:unnamed protein product [Polarella glacialis]
MRAGLTSGECQPDGGFSPASSVTKRPSVEWLPGRWWCRTSTPIATDGEREDFQPGIRPCIQPAVAWMALSVFLFWCTFVGPAAFWQRAVLRGHHENGDLWVTTSIAFRGLFAQLSTPLLGAASDRWGRRLAQALLVAAYSLWPLAIAPSAAWCVDLSVVPMALAGLGGSHFYVPFAYCANLTPQKEAHRLSEMKGGRPE